MRIREITNEIEQSAVDAFNTANGTSLTLADYQAVAFEVLSDTAIQAKLATAQQYARVLQVYLGNLQALVTDYPSAVEATAITNAITAIGTIANTAYDDLP